MFEGSFDELDKLVVVQFRPVEWIRCLRHLCVLGFIGTGNNQNAAGSENPFDFGEEGLVLADMLDRLEACDQVDALVVTRNFRASALHETHVSTSILC